MSEKYLLFVSWLFTFGQINKCASAGTRTDIAVTGSTVPPGLVVLRNEREYELGWSWLTKGKIFNSRVCLAPSNVDVSPGVSIHPGLWLVLQQSPWPDQCRKSCVSGGTGSGLGHGSGLHHPRSHDGVSGTRRNVQYQHGRGYEWCSSPIYRDTFYLSLIHIWRCRRLLTCRSRWSPYH